MTKKGCFLCLTLNKTLFSPIKTSRWWALNVFSLILLFSQDRRSVLSVLSPPGLSGLMVCPEQNNLPFQHWCVYFPYPSSPHQSHSTPSLLGHLQCWDLPPCLTLSCTFLLQCLSSPAPTHTLPPIKNDRSAFSWNLAGF